MRALLIIAGMLQFLSFLPMPDSSSILFSQNSAKITFPEKISFSTTIRSDVEISKVKLLYGTDQRTCSDVQAIALPDFKTGKQANLFWDWEMEESGSLPPGTEIWWQWKVSDETGNTVTSERKTITWLDDVHPWQVKEDNNIRLHYYNMSDQLADDFLRTAIDAQKKLETDTGMVASGEIDLLMYENSQEMRDALLYEQSWTGGMAYPDYNKIVMGVESQDIEWTKRTEAHELTHVLVGDYTFTCLWTTPAWLEEGLAVYAEGSPDESTRSAYEKAREDNNFLSFRILSASFSADSEKADLSYSQSYFMVKYLIDTYGRDKINRLLKTLSQGTTIDDALHTVYGFGLTGFEKEWRGYVGVPEDEGVQEVDEPAAVPTEISTLQPVTGFEEFKYTNPGTPQPSVTPMPSSAAGETSIVGTATPIVTLIPVGAGPGQGPNELSIALAFLCVSLTGVIILVVFRLKNRKKTGISALVLFLLSAAILSTAPVKAEGSSARATQYPQLPTPTLYTPPPPQKGFYSNPEIGISLKIPANARIDETGANSTYHFKIDLVNGNEMVTGYLFSSIISQGKTLQQIAREVRDSNLNGLVDIKQVDDKEISLENGSKAWLTISEARNPQETRTMRLSMATVRGYTTVTTLMLFAPLDTFDTFRDEIAELNSSIQVSPPMLYGYRRDELLVLAGSDSDNPQENDPATARSTGNFSLTFSGLVTYDLNLNLMPDLASSWDIRDDGLVYTFHLQPDAVFHNWRPVTADDVVYSWERAAKPETGSKTVMTYLGDIRGIGDVHTGRAEHISGLKVLDEHTLQVTLEKPVPYFLLKLTFPTSYVVDRENVEKSTTWYLTPNGTGPFRKMNTIEKESSKEVVYERFDGFYSEKPKLKAILFRMYEGTSLQLYEEGKIDYAGVSYSDLTRFTDPTEPLHDQLRSSINLCTSFITFDVTQPPFDDVKVRQAFTMALDRNEYTRVMMKGGALPAKGLYPPALPGYNKNSKGLEFDPDKARALLKESKYGDSGLPQVVFTLAGYGNSVDAGTETIAQMWEKNLGIRITIQNVDPEYYNEVVDSGDHGQLIDEGWCADYPDPQNFADTLYHSGTEMNHGHYVNPELDKLLESARTEIDVARRIDQYQKAEDIIVNDAPAIFVMHYNSYTLVKPYLQGFVGAPIQVPLERYMWIDGEKFTR